MRLGRQALEAPDENTPFRQCAAPLGERRENTPKEALDGGADRDRTCDPHNAIVVLYQLSYDPIQSP